MNYRLLKKNLSLVSEEVQETTLKPAKTALMKEVQESKKTEEQVQEIPLIPYNQNNYLNSAINISYLGSNFNIRQIQNSELIAGNIQQLIISKITTIQNQINNEQPRINAYIATKENDLQIRQNNLLKFKNQGTEKDIKKINSIIEKTQTILRILINQTGEIDPIRSIIPQNDSNYNLLNGFIGMQKELQKYQELNTKATNFRRRNINGSFNNVASVLSQDPKIGSNVQVLNTTLNTQTLNFINNTIIPRNNNNPRYNDLINGRKIDCETILKNTIAFNKLNNYLSYTLNRHYSHFVDHLRDIQNVDPNLSPQNIQRDTLESYINLIQESRSIERILQTQQEITNLQLFFTNLLNDSQGNFYGLSFPNIQSLSEMIVTNHTSAPTSIIYLGLEYLKGY